ncbi:hypothetical protein QEN42_07660 [Gordonia alkanivorans]|uniref:hypothetical protein n=1 Tax=Gordonia alkanivorans TaxID=84096 RepID=UPI00244B053D|nr:hypothetical protein [Gordonia alkanivorans]MDH3049751.1 hypothetical protein [Gordonia alkanivorans]
MFDDAVQAAIAATEDRERGCPDDPQLAQIWRDRRDGREWHPDPFIGAALEDVETGRQYCPDPILAAALEATRHLPERGESESDPEPALVVERPEARGGGDPWGYGRALEAAHERSSWVNSGAYRFADTLRVREIGGEHG